MNEKEEILSDIRNGNVNPNVVQELQNRIDEETRLIFVRDRRDWLKLNKAFSKRELITAWVYVMLREKPDFPYRKISEDRARKDFYKFYKSLDVHKHYIESSFCEKVSFRYDDQGGYRHKWEDHGKGVIRVASETNNISDFFMQKNRMTCGYHKVSAPIELWYSIEGLYSIIMFFWRMEGKSEVGRLIDESSYRSGVRLTGYMATQFKPYVATMVYDFTKAKRVYDISCGWGDRLAGFYLSNAEVYYGSDPNKESFDIYKKMALAYEEWLFEITGKKAEVISDGEDYFELKGNKTVRLMRLPAEGINFGGVEPFDLVFSSPPYFSTEEYGKGSLYEKDQSWFKYDTIDRWKNSFLYKVLDNVMPHSKRVWLNITDTSIGNNRQYICDEMVDRYSDSFQGIIGMKMSKRPKKYSDDEKDFHQGDFIEPIWCFGEKIERPKSRLETFFG